MKNFVAITGIIVTSLISCTNSETKKESVENPDGTVTTKTTEITKTTAIDSAKVNATVENVQEKLQVAGENIKEATNKTGEKLKVAAENTKDKLDETGNKIKNTHVEVKTTKTQPASK